MTRKLPFKRIRTEIAVGIGLVVFVTAGVIAAQTMSSPTPLAQPELGFTPTSTLSDRSAPGQQLLTVYLAGEELYTSPALLSREEANDTCAEYAYDTDYMWQDIKCTWGETIIYHDIFVAG